MASSYNVVLLVDAADPGLKDRIKLLALRLLNYLTCRVGLGQVRWSYRFLNSSGGRCRPPRRSDLRELGPRSWDEFEEEMQACFVGGRSSRSSSTFSAPAALTHTALLETLSDFQWDRPDITSPAKPAVVRGRRGRLIAVDEPLKAEPQAGCKNAVFILSPCPHTREQLRHFTAATGDDIGLQQLMDKLLPKGLQNIVTSKRVTLYWLDTSDWAQVWNSYDHFGYWRMVELMQLVGGKILPSESLLESAFQQVSERPNAQRKPVMIPWDSVLNSLISNESALKIRFPPQNGTVNFTAADGIGKCECAVTLEPIFVTQKHLKSFIKICLKGTVQNWNWHQLGSLTLDTWLLQSMSSSCQSPLLYFQQLLSAAVSKGLFLVADVFTEDHLIGNTGILLPISGTAAVLNVIKTEESYSIGGYHLKETEKELNKEISFDLQDIVKDVLDQINSSDESDGASDIAIPEWIKQELSQSSHWSSSIVERWYPLSGISGASGNLMESFRLISAVSFDQDEQRYDQDITHHLSECYQKKANEESGSMTQSDNQKKRLPRTPVRQKMKTMPRALQMLNAARLNSKAQKSEGAPAEKSSQAKRRSSEKSEPQTKKQTGFKSEDELITFVKEDYDKVVTGEDGLLLTCARNAFSAVKSYLKTMSSKQVEADCMDKIRHLLKTSKMIRQLYGQNPDKEAKLRECQLQALLRLEMCVQCPSIQTNEDELEQVVEEITDMLRIISLTEDPSFLTKFLTSVLAEYIGSIPKILSDIYFSLGTQIPEELALVLPTDGDDSFLREGKTPLYAQPSISRVPSVPQLANEEDQLEELRTRSAKKRRTSTLVRHRSIAESSQTLRQIEIPKKQINKETTNLNPVIMVEKLKLPVAVKPQKETEATKVRRNLFVQENQSPTRRGHKMPRSQSVSAVEGLRHKRSKTHDGTRDHKLLTKKVTETPVHKQITNRLLYRQIKGRCSESKSDVSIVEESPEKDITDVRRSPRIKQLALARRNSSFYASQPKSRNLERVHSASQEVFAAEKKRHLQSTEAKTPKRLLFGEVLGLISPPTRKARRKLLNEPEHSSLKVPERHQRRTPRKTPQKASLECEESIGRRLSEKSPCTPKRLKTPSKSPVDKKSSKNLETFFSPSKHGQSTLKSPERRSERLAQITPKKCDSPNKWLRSPLKTLNQQVTPRKGEGTRLNNVFKSPEKTPKRHSNTNTPGKQRQPLCTPQKSFQLQSSNTEPVSGLPQTPKRSGLQTPTPKKCTEGKSSVMLAFATEHTPKKHAEESMSPKTSFTTRYQLRTPQKSLSSVPQTPTPKKHLDCKSSVLPLAFESTPRKMDDSPRKHTAEVFSEPQNTTPYKTRYQLKTPQKSFPTVLQTPTPKKCVTWKKSVSLPAEYTPKKSDNSSFKSPKTTPSFKARALDVLSVSAYVPVVSTPTKSQTVNSELLPASENASYVTKVLSTRESTPDRYRPVPKHTSPVLSKTLPAELKVALPCLESSSTFNLPSPKSNFVVCENLDVSSLESSEGSGSLVNTSQTDESIDISEAQVVPTETHDLKMKLLITRKPSDAGSLPGTPKCTGNLQCASPYGLRHTVDRQQREAAARLGNPKMQTKFSTPKSQRKPVPPPTYEVQLEMRESGLPKLRFKRTDSSSTVDLTSGVRVEDSPVVPCARKAEEGPFGETWCNKHMMRLESGCASPRLRSSYNTPGKGSLQTLICQSYTPKRCASNTASPTQVEAVSPWTPSPKYKEKNGSDFINNWPRRKKASAVKAASVLNVDKTQDYAVGTMSAEEQGVEHDAAKATSLNDFLFDGVSKLQGNSPVIDWKGNSDIGTMTFKSRKRCFEPFSPTKEAQPRSKRSCFVNNVGDLEECVSSSQSLCSNLSSSLHSSCEDEVFSVAVITPPAMVSHSLSTSGLLTLTHSPMLFKGRTPSSKRKMQDSESQQSTPEQKRTAIHSMNPDDSPFSSAAPKRTISRTYTRKKLIT